MPNASFKMNAVEIFSENNQTVTAKNINVAANDLTTPSMCKAWVNFNGTLAMTVGSSYGPDAPPADYSSPNPIRASYNVESIIDRGTGDYEIHFDNDMPDVNYCSLFTPGGTEITSTANFDVPKRGSTPSVGSIRIMVSNGNQNINYCQLAIFR